MPDYDVLAGLGQKIQTFSAGKAFSKAAPLQITSKVKSYDLVDESRQQLPSYQSSAINFSFYQSQNAEKVTMWNSQQRKSKTPGYHRDIFRHLTLLKMRCKEKLSFPTSILLLFGRFEFFHRKNSNFVRKKAYQEILPISMYIAANFLIFPKNSEFIV